MLQDVITEVEAIATEEMSVITSHFEYKKSVKGLIL